MKIFQNLFISVCVLISLLLSGCGGGGFSESTSGSGAAGGGSQGSTTEVLLAGEVMLPGSSTTSRLKASVSRSVALAGARMDLFLPEDLRRENSLLVPGTVVKADKSGRFAFLRSQIQSEALSSPVVLTARSGEVLLQLLLDLGDASTGIQDATVTYQTDAAVRFLNEEVLQSSAGATRLSEVQASPWYASFQTFATKLALKRNEWSSLLSNLPYNPSNHQEADSSAGKLFETVVQSDDSFAETLNSGLRLKARAGLEPVRAAARPTSELRLRLASQFLLAGYTVLGQDDELLWLNRQTQLEFSDAPTTGLQATASEIAAALGVTPTQVASFPLPSSTLHFRPSELASLKTLGSRYDEYVTRMARSMLRLPWIQTSALQALQNLPTQDTLPLNSFYRALASAYRQEFWPVERVRSELQSGGRIVPGERVVAPGAFGGATLDPKSRLNFLVDLQPQASSAAFESALLNDPRIWMSWMPASLRLAHHRLQEQGQSIVSSQALYPDPVSESSARFEVLRNLNSSLQFATRQAQSALNLLADESGLIREAVKSQQTGGFSTETMLSRVSLPSLGVLFAELNPPLMESQGLFKEIAGGSGQSPRIENMSLISYQPSRTQSLWNQVLSAANSPGVSLSQGLVLQNYQNSLESLRVTTLNWLRTIPAQNSSVTINGRVLKDTGSPASRFLLRLLTVNQASVLSQTDSEGNFRFEGLQGDQRYRLEVEVRDLNSNSVPVSNHLTLSFDFWLSGYEQEVRLDDILLRPSFETQASHPPESAEAIVPANFLAKVELNPVEPVVSDVVALDLQVCDEEGDPVDLKFGFTVGNTSLVTTSSPRISASSSPQTTFPLDGVLLSRPSRPLNQCTTMPYTYYWHSREDMGLGGALGNASQQDVRASFSVRESQRSTEFDQASVSGFFDLDNEAPSLEFEAPLESDPATTRALLTLQGTAADVSKIQSIVARNTSLQSQPIRTYSARNLGSGFGSWEIENFPVEPGVLNQVHFYAEDEFGNRNLSPYVLRFSALDTAAPSLVLTSVTVFQARNQPVLRSFQSTQYTTVTTVDLGGGSIRYELPQTSIRRLGFDLLTTGRIELAGRAFDVSGVQRLQLNSTQFQAQSTDGVRYQFRREIDLGSQSLPFSASSTTLRLILSGLDNNNNDSRPQSYQEALQGRNSILIDSEKIDIDSPTVAVLEPSGGMSSQTVQATTQLLRVAAADESRITSFQACSSLACQSLQVVPGTMEYTGVLPLREATSNRITASIEDEWGFRRTFPESSPLTILNLNDITPPSLVVTSVFNAAAGTTFLPLRIDTTTPDSPRSTIQVLNVTDCASASGGGTVTNCSVTLSGVLSDVSGFDLTEDGRGNYAGFRMRMNSLNAGQFDPDTASSRRDLLGTTGTVFPNQRNISVLQANEVTATPGVVPFTAELNLQDDGYWPVVLQLSDDSKSLFTGHEVNSIEKREAFYVKRDTQGPAFSDLSIADQGFVTGGVVPLSGRAVDRLSNVTSVFAGGVAGSLAQAGLNLSPWSQFVSLPQESSVAFSVFPTMESGAAGTLPLTAIDSFGRQTTMALNLSVYPLHLDTLSSTAQFETPVDIGFTGVDGSQVAITDKGQARIEVLDSKGETVRTFTGIVGNSSYENFQSLEFSDIRRGQQGALTLESILLGARFSRPAFEILDTLNQYEISGSLESRTSVLLSTSSSDSLTPLTYATGIVGRYTPEFEFVSHIYQPAATGQPQLFRYVRSFRDVSPSTAPSEGGLTDSTGLNGVELGSEVHTLVVTQIHVPGLGSLDDPEDSREYVYLSEPSRNRIAAYMYRNRYSNPGYQTTDTLILPQGIEPTAFDLSRDGRRLWVADRRDNRIHLFGVAGSQLSTVTVFGGEGVRNGEFLEIDSIRGFSRPGNSEFESLYVVDSKAQRISVLTTNGEFQRYLGSNPFATGGFREPVLLGPSSEGGVLVLDEEKLAVDWIGTQSASAGSFRTGDFAPANTFRLQDARALSQISTTTLQNQDKLTDPSFFSASAVPLSVTTVSRYAMSPQTLFRRVQTSSSSFTAVSTSSSRLVLTTQSAPLVSLTSYSQAVQAFSGLRDMAHAVDIEERIYLLEDTAGVDHVQMLAPESGLQTMASLSTQSSARFVCTMGASLVVVGEAPVHMAEVYDFGASSRILPNGAAFHSLPLLDWQGVSASVSSPTGLSCRSNLLALAQAGRVDVFEKRSDGFYQVQSLRSTDTSLASTDPLRTLTGSLDVSYGDNLLWILERERDRLHRYQASP